MENHLPKKFIDSVGSEIFTNSNGVGSSVEAIVSPMFISSIPETATILPAFAVSAGTLSSPSYSYIFVILTFLHSSGFPCLLLLLCHLG